MKIAAITAERVASLVPSCERAAPGATVPEAQLPQQHLSCSGVSECRCWARLRLLVHARRETHHRLPCRDASTVSQFGGRATGWEAARRNLTFRKSCSSFYASRRGRTREKLVGSWSCASMIPPR
jgi:hypothetical protein